MKFLEQENNDLGIMYVDYGTRETSLLSLVLPFVSCVTLGKLLILSLCLGFLICTWGIYVDVMIQMKVMIFMGINKMPSAMKGNISGKTRKNHFRRKKKLSWA